MRKRNPKEKAIDILLLMYLIKRGNKEGGIWGITKLQKLVFLVEHAMLEDRVKGFNHTYYKWKYGPFSKELYNDFDALIDEEILTEEGGIKLTKRGKKLLKEYGGVLRKNEEVLQYIEGKIEKYVNKSLKEIKSEVYDIETTISGLGDIKIRKIPQGFNLLTKLEEEEIGVSSRFEISDEWIETLDILLDREAYKSLKKATKSESTKWEPSLA